MKSILKAILTLLLGIAMATWFTGCGSTGPKFNGFSKAKQNKGLLYIYRPWSMGSGGRSFVVYDLTSKTKIGVLSNGSYLKYDVSPGKKTIRVLDEDNVGADVAFVLMAPVINAIILSDSKSDNFVYSVDIQPNTISCIRWNPNDVFNGKNGVVDRVKCTQEILKTSKQQ